jgi:hypothetical protein
MDRRDYVEANRLLWPLELGTLWGMGKCPEGVLRGEDYVPLGADLDVGLIGSVKI